MPNPLSNVDKPKLLLEYVVQIKHKGKVIAQETLPATAEILTLTREREFEMIHIISERVAPKAVEAACAYYDTKLKKNAKA